MRKSILLLSFSLYCSNHQKDALMAGPGSAGSPSLGGSAQLGGASGSHYAGSYSGSSFAGIAGSLTCLPNMISIPQGFCIDATETSQSAYKSWLDSNPPTSNQIPECSWNSSFLPKKNFNPPSSIPVSNIDWCDAFAFCAQNNKHLCRQISNLPLPYQDSNNPSKSQWLNACSKNGSSIFPYGNIFLPNTCNGADNSHTPLPIASKSSCVSYPGLFDMSGNLAEWEDSCDGPNKWNYCNLRGGSFCNNSSPMGLACTASFGSNRDNSDDRYGFRCCLY